LTKGLSAGLSRSIALERTGHRLQRSGPFDAASGPKRRETLTTWPSSADAHTVLLLRLLYTIAVMAMVIWLLRAGNPIGGLLVVPAAAVWLRREAESGRLAARARRLLSP
jgi:hypothetical protein